MLSVILAFLVGGAFGYYVVPKVVSLVSGVKTAEAAVANTVSQVTKDL